METIHIVVGILAVLGSGFLYHQKLREELINQRIDTLAKSCVDGLDDIKQTLKEIKQKIEEHTTDNTTFKVEMQKFKNDMENVTNKVGRLEAWFGKVLESK